MSFVSYIMLHVNMNQVTDLLVSFIYNTRFNKMQSDDALFKIKAVD